MCWRYGSSWHKIQCVHGEQGQQLKPCFAKGGTTSSYANKDVHPETYKGRTTTPVDIDVFTENIEEFDKIVDKIKIV